MLLNNGSFFFSDIEFLNVFLSTFYEIVEV